MVVGRKGGGGEGEDGRRKKKEGLKGLKLNEHADPCCSYTSFHATRA